jgi:hypothetical protein
MTVLDANLQFSDSQALTVDADSTNYYNASSDRDIGVGEPMAVVVYAESAFGGTTPTIAVSVETDDNTSFSSGTILTTSQAYTPATLTAANDKIVIPLPMTNEQYIQLNYDMEGTSPTLTVSAYLMPLSMVENRREYPNNYTIS